MKKNATRKALFTSVLALVMCLSMLMGTTFAWFTDSAASANNIIQPGNLDVKLEYWDGDSYEEVTPAQKLFDDNALWEPGHVEVAYLKVSNAGSLALKYQLNVNVFKETVGKTMAGADLKLSDHLVFGVVDKELTTADDMYSREAARLAAGDAKGLKAYNGATKNLAVGGSDYLALIIYMPAEVGNEANHDGVNLPAIEMGVNVMATQFTYEEDSFGPDYDEDAIYTDAIVTNEEELKEALANAKNGAVIGIKGNVTWTTGAGIGSTPFVASVTRATTAKSITLLGLEEGATLTATGAGVGAIGIDDGTVTFKNLKIADESVSYAEDSWEFGYLEFRGNTVFENCDIVNAIMMDGDSAKFVNCSFNSNKTKEYAVWVSNGTASFENCHFTGFRGLKTHEAYGSEVVAISVNNCEFVDITEKPGMAIGTVNAATEIKLTNNEFIGTQAGDQGLYIYETDTDVTTFKFVNENNKAVGADSSLPAGLYKADDGVYYATTSGALQQGIGKLVAGDTLVIYNDVDFATTQLNVDKAITIDLNGNEFATTNARPVRLTNGASIKNGTINVTTTVAALVVQGNEKVSSIENVTIHVTTPEGKTTTGIQLYNGKHVDVIKNVTITGVTQGIEVANGSSVGLMENVKVEALKTGLQVQQSTIGEIKNSSFYGETNGVWAQLKGTNDVVLKFTNTAVSGGDYGLYMCDEGATIVPDGIAYLTYDAATTFDGGIKDTEYAFGQSGKLVINGAKIGAFIANAEDLFAFAKMVNVDKKSFNGLTVLLTADIDLANEAWTPIGQTGNCSFQGTFDGQGHTISNLNVDTTGAASTSHSSGLFGWLFNATVKNLNVKNATVVGEQYIGVIAGYLEWEGCTIENCHVTGATVTGKHVNNDHCGDKVGVIAGFVGNAGTSVKGCSATDCTVTAGRDAGQIAGAAKTANVVDCEATNVTVTASGDCTSANVNNAVIGRVL